MASHQHSNRKKDESEMKKLSLKKSQSVLNENSH